MSYLKIVDFKMIFHWYHSDYLSSSEWTK